VAPDGIQDRRRSLRPVNADPERADRRDLAWLELQLVHARHDGWRRSADPSIAIVNGPRRSR
jgi:hypothetical protein